MDIPWEKIGSDRAVQNPTEALPGGKYTDIINPQPLETRLPVLPKAPDPSAFRISGGK